MLSVLVEVGVGRALVDALHGDGRLQLVQLRRAHGIELLAADEAVLRQGQQVIAPHSISICFRIEIGTQLRGQDMVEPGGLV